MRIILDAFGGDNAPDESIKGAAQAVKAYGHTVLLVGQESVIRERMAALHIPEDGLEILNATTTIAMDDEPRSILKEKKDCSMAVGLTALSEGKGDAFVSGGSTGALIMGSTFLVKRIKGVSRAALGGILPSPRHPSLLLDMGANVDCRPEMLLQFAHMGSIFMSNIVKNGEPATVGLLNVGTEDTKGGELQLEAFNLLKESNLHFIGNVEAREVLPGAADVVVTDGFSGNILLKGMEGAIGTVMGAIKKAFLTNLKTKLAGLLVKSRISELKAEFGTKEYGGAILLGIRKPVIKAHGNSDALAFQHAIRVAGETVSSQVVEKISDAIQASKLNKEDTDA